MKKFNPNKSIIIALVIVLVTVTIISLSAARRAQGAQTNVAQSVVNDSVGIMDRIVAAPVNFVEKTVKNAQDLFTTYSENQRLKAKLDTYSDLAQDKKNNEREIKALKQELDLKNSLTNYDTVSANVITRSPDSWQDTLIVDRGSKDGIKQNMAVMSQSGLVGRIVEVNMASSKVELLTSANQNSNHFPVRISAEDGEAFGLLRGYDEKTGAMIVDQLTGDKQIKAGDTVQTSGLGGNSPADLSVGKVVEFKASNFGLDKKVYVKPNAQMYDISVVTIIQRTAGEE